MEVVSSYLPLKRSGRNFAGLCPFHTEKTPSFMVSPERQAWRCFGCSEGGDVFTFLEKIEGWDFPETLEELAKRAGVKLQRLAPSPASREKEKLFSIHRLTAKFYHYLLTRHALGEPARKYLARRGIPQDLWEKFDLGFAPGGWDTLVGFLTKRGFDLAQVATAGLVVSREERGPRGYFDRFRNRLMFSLKDGRGEILGFSGRLIEDVTSNTKQVTREAKYINSPQTPIFTKGNILFGLDVVRQAIREKNQAVLVEGEFDVLSLVKAGIENVVASKGTALTEKQAVILSRICEKVVMCFDTDLAGDAAARRGIELLDMAGLSIAVADLGKFKDPDEFAQKDPKGIVVAIGAARDIYDYFLESAARRFDAKTADGKKRIGRELLPILGKISDDMVRAHYIGKLAGLLSLDTHLVAEAVEKKRPLLQFSQDQAKAKTGGELESYFLALLLARDEVLGDFLTKLAPEDFASDEARGFWKWARDIMKSLKKEKAGWKKLLLGLPPQLAEFVDSLFLRGIAPDLLEKDNWAAELSKTGERIRQISLKRRLGEMSGKIRQAEAANDAKLVSVLTQKFDKLKGEFYGK